MISTKGIENIRVKKSKARESNTFRKSKRVIISHLMSFSRPILHFRVLHFIQCILGRIRERSAGSLNLSDTVKLL